VNGPRRMARRAGMPGGRSFDRDSPMFPAVIAGNRKGSGDMNGHLPRSVTVRRAAALAIALGGCLPARGGSGGPGAGSSPPAASRSLWTPCYAIRTSFTAVNADLVTAPVPFFENRVPGQVARCPGRRVGHAVPPRGARTRCADDARAIRHLSPGFRRLPRLCERPDSRDGLRIRLDA